MVLTTPPLEIVSIPGPPVLPPPTARPSRHSSRDPGPVTVAVKDWITESIAAKPWVLSTPPLQIVSDTAGVDENADTARWHVTVTSAGAVIDHRGCDETGRKGLVGDCSVPPLMTESVPPSTTMPGRGR